MLNLLGESYVYFINSFNIFYYIFVLFIYNFHCFIYFCIFFINKFFSLFKFLILNYKDISYSFIIINFPYKFSLHASDCFSLQLIIHFWKWNMYIKNAVNTEFIICSWATIDTEIIIWEKCA